MVRCKFLGMQNYEIVSEKPNLFKFFGKLDEMSEKMRKFAP